MPLFEGESLEELQVYKPARNEPADFDAFWQETIAATRAHPLNADFQPVDVGITTLDIFDVSFAGYAGQTIKGWFLLPKNRSGLLPCIVQYIGYGSGRGFPYDWLLWASAGYANFVMDTRGQGSSGLNGDTPDFPIDGANPFHPGFMTQGILDPKTYYYRRVYSDAVRAVEAARSHDAVDADRIAVTGRSQGGGITLAVAGLLPEVSLAMPGVPFLCHFRHAAEITPRAPYTEIANYCKVHRDKIDTVFNTLNYFDGVNFAARANAKALFSVGMMDDICPPSTVFAAYNHYAGEKDMRAWHFNNHEGGETFMEREVLDFVRESWG
jgi:cephalosporin-C deacetylase